MALALEMMQGGMSAGGARAVNGFPNLTLSAAGTTISDATVIKASHIVVTTVASGSGVLLPNSEIGDEVMIFNATGTNALTVYPPTSSATINQLSAGTGALLPPYTACKYKKSSATAWHAWMSN